ncbi:hypothetical protein [Streptomyces sp. Ru87]|uniref:hypothetical protein n=1 Tax=Streptomyces sp. Ru87 TaxID=2044307 RepID=UPI000BF528BE|nr:hypothetical protein [Streptomyces sp. Ru87]PGH50325.1 hypothetical protein CRI70_12760 [Streptomyces sp. Ru87]
MDTAFDSKQPGTAPARTPARAPDRGGSAPHGLLAVQRTAGNAATVEMLRRAGHRHPLATVSSLPVQRMYNPGHGGHGGGGAGFPPQGFVKEESPDEYLTPEETMARVASLVDNPPMENYGARRQGRAHGEFWMRFPRDKSNEAAEETLTETSALLFDSMKGAQEKAREDEPDKTAEDANNREVQGMLINDRLVFATNYNSSVDTLVERGRKKNKGGQPTFQELLSIRQSDEGATRGLRGHEAENQREKLASFRRKNAAIVAGERGEGEQGRGEDATALALRARLGEPVIVVNIEDEKLREYLTSRKYEGRVFLLRFAALDPRAKKTGKNKGQPTAEGSVHAEQKLLLALQYANIVPHQDVKGPMSIMGKYRPCMGCAAALMYYKRRLEFTNLSFDENYGHYFQGAVNSLYDHQRHIMDKHYLEYIRQMVMDDITNTPAMMNEAAPQEAVHRRGGPALRVPGRYASRQADVTPPTSDAEFDDEGHYHRTTRPLKDTWTVETAHVGIGQGSQTHNVPRRKHEQLSEAQAAELKALWNGRKGMPPTNESRQRAIELAYGYKNSERMTLKYLGGIIELDANRLGGYLTRYENEGHWKHTPSRSGKVENQPKSHKKGDPAKQFTKGGKLDGEGKKTLKALIRSLTGHPWCDAWQRIHDNELPQELNPSQMPDELLMKLAELRRQKVDVPSMSKYMHTGEKGDNLRKAITRKGEPLLEKQLAAAAQVKTEPEDVEMGGTASYPTASTSYAESSTSYAEPSGSYAEPSGSYAAPSGSSAPGYPQGRTADYGYGSGGGADYGYGYDAGEGSSSSAYPPAPAEVPGFTLHIDPGTNQPYYIDEDTGGRYIRVHGRMTRIRFSDDVEMEDA